MWSHCRRMPQFRVMEKPWDYIEGLRRHFHRSEDDKLNPRSTVGTVIETGDICGLGAHSISPPQLR